MEFHGWIGINKNECNHVFLMITNALWNFMDGLE
jgi:hypothetical protein